MTKIAVVYHSGFGHTRAVAESIVRGAASIEGTDASLIGVDDLPGPGPDKSLGGRWPELDAADAIVMGCPTYMGSVSAAFKVFMETSSPVWMTQGWRGKLAAGFTNAGGLCGDKANCLQDIAAFAAQHGMLWFNPGMYGEAPGINRLGASLGLQTQSDNAPVSETPPPEDHRTAELFGSRVAVAAARWARGAG
jgi:NAD(P)H dehydrogenase (quinone)